MCKLLHRNIKFVNHKTLINLYDFQPLYGENTFVQDSATIIGDVNIASESFVGNNVVIKGDMNFIFIGEHTKIEDRVSIMTLNRIPGSMEIA